MFILDGLVNNIKCHVLLDSGATHNFIHPRFLKSDNKLNSFKNVKLANGSSISHYGSVNCVLQLQDFVENVDFEIVDIVHDVILGKPWLSLHNPDIDWNEHVIEFTDKNTKFRILNSNVMSNSLQINSLESVNAIDHSLSYKHFVNAIELEDEIFVCQVDFNLNTADFKEKIDNGAAAFIVSQFSDVFPDELPNKLPPDCGVEFEIDTLPGSQPTSKPIYRLSYSELDELKKQLDELLSKNIIQPSKSPYGAPYFLSRKRMAPSECA